MFAANQRVDTGDLQHFYRPGMVLHRAAQILQSLFDLPLVHFRDLEFVAQFDLIQLGSKYVEFVGCGGYPGAVVGQ